MHQNLKAMFHIFYSTYEAENESIVEEREKKKYCIGFRSDPYRSGVEFELFHGTCSKDY